MEHRRSKDINARPFQIVDDGQKAMILQLSSGQYEEFGKRHRIIGSLEEAIDYLEKWPWGNTIIKVDTISAKLL